MTSALPPPSCPCNLGKNFNKCGPPKCNEPIKNIRIDEPYYDICTFGGRFQHWLAVTFPTRAFTYECNIDQSATIIRHFRHKRLRECVTEPDLWHHRYIEYSHVHPESGENFHTLTRWPSQVIMNTVIAAGMLTFNKTFVTLAFWQWANQSYQTYVAWNHRKIHSCISDKQLFHAYLLGTAASVGTAVGLKALLMRHMKQPPFFVPKLIPLAALLVGNLFTIPALHAQELRYGAPVFDKNDKPMGSSVLAAQYDVTQQIIMKTALYTLPMLLAPLIIHPFRTDNVYWFCRYPFLRPLAHFAILGSLFALTMPLSLALFREKGCMPYCDLEPHIRYRIQQRFGNEVPMVVFYQSEC